MEQSVSRRGFIGAAIGTGAAAAVSPSVALAHGWDRRGRGSSGRVPRDRRGIQMWTVRRLTPDQAGAQRVLNALGRMGYYEIEKFQTYGWTVEQFRAALRRAGLRCISGHDGPGFPATAGWEDGYRRGARVRGRARPAVHRPRVVAGAVQPGGAVAPAGRPSEHRG